MVKGVVMAKIIDEIEYLTVKEFAEEVGITTQAVYKQLNNQLQGRFKKDGKKTLIEKSAISMFQKKNDQPVDNQLQTELYNQLRNQLQEKDAQIAQLQKLLDQEQQLTLVANKRVLELENRTRALEDHNKELEIQANKTWIQRLFGK